MTISPTLVVPQHVFADIRRIILETPDGYETGVALFGASVGPRRVVLAVSGPGPRATHEPAHYASDADYASGVYCALKSALPSIRWLGELHVHPRGMTWLSHGDHRTVRDVLTNEAEATDTVRPDEFIAGVMQRRADGVEIYPFYFSRAALGGAALPIERVAPDDPVVREARAHASEAPLGSSPETGRGQEKAEDSPSRCQKWVARVVHIIQRARLDSEKSAAEEANDH